MNQKILPPAQQVAEYVWMIPHLLPADHPDFVSTYVLLDKAGDIHVIDPGWDSAENWRGLESGLQQFGWRASDICSVTLTHQHKDHVGLADQIRQVTGCPIAIHRADQEELLTDHLSLAKSIRLGRIDSWNVPQAHAQVLIDEIETQKQNVPPRIVADVILADGDYLLIPGRDLKIHHTPGHTPGHICIEDTQQGIVFTGDHVVQNFNPGVGLGKIWRPEAMLSYLDSIEKIGNLSGTIGFAGHGQVIEDLPGRCRIIASHHQNRINEIDSMLASNPHQSTWELARALTWAKPWEAMTPTIRRMILSQTEMYRFAAESDQ